MKALVPGGCCVRGGLVLYFFWGMLCSVGGYFFEGGLFFVCVWGGCLLFGEGGLFMGGLVGRLFILGCDLFSLY